MALETVINYSEDPLSYYYGFRDVYSNTNYGYNEDDPGEMLEQRDRASMEVHENSNWEDQLFYNMTTTVDNYHELGIIDENTPDEETVVVAEKKRRRRARAGKNKEELETQRMTHITVERNRRRQMNDYLAALRSLMPPSFVHRGDQASIIGGAINYVKELEQQLQSMETCNNNGHDHDHDHDQNELAGRHRLANFFSFPQYSTRGNSSNSTCTITTDPQAPECHYQSNKDIKQWAAVADIEVTMVDSHANLKILAKKRPRLLLRLVTGLQALGLGILHLNATTADQMVLYSVSVKIEDWCQMNTVDEIASALNRMLRRIQEDTTLFT